MRRFLRTATTLCFDPAAEPLAEVAAGERAAYTDLVERLHRGHGFSRTDAYHLLGHVGRLHVGNMIDPFYSVLATVERRYLELS